MVSLFSNNVFLIAVAVIVLLAVVLFVSYVKAPPSNAYIISLLWCCAAFFLGYIYGRRWLVDDAQHVIRLSVRETTAEDLATVIMLGMEKGIIVRDGCVYQGTSHLDDCPCTVKGSSGGVNRHSLLIGAYRYFDQHPDKDWIVNNAIYRYNKTGQWRN